MSRVEFLAMVSPFLCSALRVKRIKTKYSPLTNIPTEIVKMGLTNSKAITTPSTRNVELIKSNIGINILPIIAPDFEVILSISSLLFLDTYLMYG